MLFWACHCHGVPLLALYGLQSMCCAWRRMILTSVWVPRSCRLSAGPAVAHLPHRGGGPHHHPADYAAPLVRGAAHLGCMPSGACSRCLCPCWVMFCCSARQGAQQAAAAVCRSGRVRCNFSCVVEHCDAQVSLALQDRIRSQGRCNWMGLAEVICHSHQHKTTLRHEGRATLETQVQCAAQSATCGGGRPHAGAAVAHRCAPDRMHRRRGVLSCTSSSIGRFSATNPGLHVYRDPCM